MLARDQCVAFAGVDSLGIDDDLLNPVNTDRRGPAGPGLIDQALEASFDKS